MSRQTRARGVPGSRRLRASGHERGATMVEAAMIMPLLFLLIFGIMETGLLVKAYSTTANAVRAGGRDASIAGNDGNADQLILARMDRESRALGSDLIYYVIVWHADGPGDPVPPGCVSLAEGMTSANTTSAGVSDGGTDAMDACNIYARPRAAGGAFDMAAGRAGQPTTYYFGCTGNADPERAHRVDCRWPPPNRKSVISPRVLPSGTTRLTPDYVGVYMKVTHRSATGAVRTHTITESSINLIEPSTYGVGT